MIRSWVLAIVCLLAGVALGSWVTADLSAMPPVPLPAGASPELQRAIEEAGPPNVAARRLLSPQSESQWRFLIEQRSDDRRGQLDRLAKSFGVSAWGGQVEGVPVYWISPLDLAPEMADQLFIYVHGGAYVFGGGEGGALEAAGISATTGIPTISIDYRMPPDHPHPAAVDDVEKVYRALLQDHDPTKMALGGTSAGGGLTMASIHRFKDRSLPLPAAIYLGTPWADLTKTSDTLYTMEGVDRILGTHDGILKAAAQLYAGETDLKDPLVSPVYGDFSDFPPAYLVTGTRDMLLSDTARVAQKMRVAGTEVDLIVFEGLSHAEYALVADSPESRQAYQGLAEFLRLHLGRQDGSDDRP